MQRVVADGAQLSRAGVQQLDGKRRVRRGELLWCALKHGLCGALALTLRPGLRRAVGALPGQGLTQRQRWLALLGLVLVPYIKAKAEREYVQRRGGAAASMGLLDESQVRSTGVVERALRC